ncbi:MAG: iron ABC transporter permease [Burkholderiales bacterium]|nr:iron ABC transporter permease [Burkholderiales bacterium]
MTARPAIIGGRSTRLARSLPSLGVLALLGYLVVVPLVLLLVASLKPTGLPLDPGWTLQSFRDVYSDRAFYALALTTFQFALGCMAGALAVGGVLAWLVERTDLPWKPAMRAAIVVPMVLPPFLLAMGWALLASPRTGFFTLLLKDALALAAPPLNIYSLGGMIFVETLALVPSTFLILSPAFRNMDPSLEEAAMMSGAGLGAMLRRVFIPVLTPALLAAAAYLLMVGFLVFDVPGTLGMPVGIFVLSSRIVYLASDQSGGISAYQLISAMAMTFLALLLLLAWVYRRATRRASRYVTVTGKGFRPRELRLGRLRAAAFAFIGTYFFLSVAAPLAILGWNSLMPFQAPVSLEMLHKASLANHADALRNPRIMQATWRSLWVSALSATLVCALAMACSWIFLRTRQVGGRLIDTLAFLPLAIPGTMIGMALIYVYLTLTFIPVYGTAWILVIAYTTVYLSYASRTTNGVLVQLHPELEEAALLCGASTAATLRRVVLPLIFPALLGAWIWVVAHVMRELSTALLLQGEDNTMLAVQLWNAWSGGQPNKAAAIGLWLVGMMAVATIGWQWMAARSQRTTT